MGKNLKKVLFSVLLLAAVIIVSPKDAKAAGDVWMTGTNRDSVTIQWNVPSTRTGVTITSYYIKSSDEKVIWEGTGTQATIGRLGTGYTSSWSVGYNYTTSSGSYTGGYVGAVRVNTTPSDISTRDFGFSSLGVNDTQATFVVNRPVNATKVDLEVYNAKNKRVATNSFYMYSNSVKLQKGMAYKYRVRAYYTNSGNNRTYYGRWSGYRYLTVPNATLKRGKKSIKVSIKKGTGVASYTVYISNKKDSGFKKVKTFKVGKKSKYSVTIKKYGKKKLKGGSSYSVRVVPKVKFGGKTYSSDTIAQSNYVYVYR